MFSTLLLTLLLLAVGVLFLCIRMLLVKGGKFPNPHVGGNKALQKRGIGCVQSQDWEARHKPRFSIDEVEKAVNDSLNKSK